MKTKNYDSEMNITLSSGGKSVTTSLENLRIFERLLIRKRKEIKQQQKRK